MVRGVRRVAVLLVVALFIAACGGRLSEDQIKAELRTDGGGGGTGVGVGAGDGTGVGSDGFADGVTSSDPTGLGTGTGSDPGTGPSTGPGGGAGPNGAPPAPEGGNGGATDVGVSATEVKVGNIATLGGPVPGLFRGALVGTQAFFAYQNSLGGLYGRKFTVLSADDNFDAGTYRNKTKELAPKVFSFVGSFSLFDDAGASELKKSGALDVGRSLGAVRQALPNSFSPQPFQEGWPTTGCKWLKGRYPKDVIEHAAIFIGAADAARNNAKWQKKSCINQGFKFVYEREVQATESNFTGDVVQMRNRGVKAVFIVFDVSGIARFFSSINQQGFNPPLKYPSPAAYDGDFIKLAGKEAAEGIIIGQSFSMFLGEDARMVPEISKFKEWMARVDPSQKTDLFALYGWLSGMLFVQAYEKAGPKAKRTDLIKVLGGIHDFSGNDLLSPMDVGNKVNTHCEMYMQVSGGAFKRLDPAKGYQCDGAFLKY